ncbi:UDP-GalNAc:beta-1,3-N-acetylgalactosaminyltransferase 1 [Lepisosteus oculatus]|uniref:UDP-GalNAc:beta-1, 3-N-acetylgalactosaminyltransferase 1 n=1 Tax=Lepisosteus oculatus TaxID=7918 RepID=UPI0035F50B5B
MKHMFLKTLFLGLIFTMLTLMLLIINRSLASNTTYSSNKALNQGINWLYFYESEPVRRPCLPFLLPKISMCKHKVPFLVIFVASTPGRVEHRMAIRASWGSKRYLQGKYILTLFLLGREKETAVKPRLSLEEEHFLFRDLIMQDFLDTYENLTLKTRMAFHWMYEFCPRAQYIMKTDTDVFINVINLVQFLLKTRYSSGGLYTGFPFVHSYPYRSRSSKNFISHEEYPFDQYPPYCSGFGYVISGKLALRIYEMMWHVKPFRIEDVYVGVCVQLVGGVLYIPQDDLFLLYKKRRDSRILGVIAVHGVVPEDMVSYWKMLQEASQ